MKVLCVDTVKDSYTKNGKKAKMPPIYIGTYYNVVGNINWLFKGRNWLLYELE